MDNILTDIKRREFLQKISLIIGAASISTSLPWLGENLYAENNSSKSKVRIGIIGVGSRGMYHLQILKTLPQAEIIAICDNYSPNLEKAANLLEKGVFKYEQYPDLLENKNIDAVLIATPLYLHAKMTIDSLMAGKHVFCEKAMAKTIEDCRMMVKAHINTGLLLQIGHQRMFSIKYLTAYKNIQDGRIGKITQIRAFWHRNNNWRRAIPNANLERKINWRLYSDYSCGLMTELASHHIQVANWYVNQTPDYVLGSGSLNYWKDGRDVFDNVNVIYHYPNDVHLLYDSLTSNVHYGLEVQIMGDKGTIEIEKGKIYSEFPPPSAGIIQLIEDVEKKTFNTLPLSGSSWVPDHSLDNEGKNILNYNPQDENVLQLESFLNSIYNHNYSNHCKILLKEAYNASIATLLGHQAMLTKSIVYWKKEFDFNTI